MITSILQRAPDRMLASTLMEGYESFNSMPFSQQLLYAFVSSCVLIFADVFFEMSHGNEIAQHVDSYNRILPNLCSRTFTEIKWLQQDYFEFLTPGTFSYASRIYMANTLTLMWRVVGQ